jgi:hypothetical protein
VPQSGPHQAKERRALDINRLNTGEKVIGVSGILLFVFSFFNWLGVSVSGSSSFGLSASKSAWGFPLLLIAVLLGVVMVGIVVAKAFGAELPALGSVTWSQVLLGIAAVVFLFILIKLIVGPSNWEGASIPSAVSKDRKIGIFLGLIASIGLVAGAYLNAKETGDLPGAIGGAKGDSAPPPPPGPPTA